MAKTILSVLFAGLMALSCQQSETKKSPKQIQDALDLTLKDTCKCDSSIYQIDKDAYTGERRIIKFSPLSNDYKMSLKTGFVPVECTIGKSITDSTFFIFFKITDPNNKGKNGCYTLGNEAIFIMEDSLKITLQNRKTNCDNMFYYTCSFSNFTDLQTLAGLRMKKVKAVRFYNAESYTEIAVDSMTSQLLFTTLNCVYKR